ncbi:hypothetical protein OOU_Y34scaffold00641g66 [Pyricularia oryzae Y34]|uniref:Uncharacterized protein n=3 Tax=Pyricularia oryzae TaxID=318829 RepID=A0A4P7N514_PYROR|nr:hypothetical protein OOU_Y34scaffold00641g66 [Pyricularia oryzae Y34]QBZ56662.1 hypothetical protein PoMZ_01574 [Pyricularia oryzae]
MVHLGDVEIQLARVSRQPMRERVPYGVPRRRRASVPPLPTGREGGKTD